jgi:hypothetical protein
MTTALYVTAAVIAVGVLCLVVGPILRYYRKYSGTRVITCPENHKPAAVDVDTSAAINSAFGTPKVSLSDCSRWPEKAGCGQECLSQIENSPADCLVRNIISRWYQGKSCVICGTGLGQTDWFEHRPALLTPEKKTLQWRDVPPERVPELLENHSPVCWNCAVAKSFHSEHPDLVVERPWRKEDYHHS